METIRSPCGVPAAPPARGGGGSITRHSKDQLVMTGQRRTAGFRILYSPTLRLEAEGNPPGDGVLVRPEEHGQAELAFVVERPQSAYRFDIWTRAGCRTGDDAASLETWKSVFEEQSQRVDVPAWAEALVLEAWAGGEGRDADICTALQQVHRRLSSPHENAIAPNAGAEGTGR